MTYWSDSRGEGDWRAAGWARRWPEWPFTKSGRSGGVSSSDETGRWL